jgi:hypothetical protein
MFVTSCLAGDKNTAHDGRPFRDHQLSQAWTGKRHVLELARTANMQRICTLPWTPGARRPKAAALSFACSASGSEIASPSACSLATIAEPAEFRADRSELCKLSHGYHRYPQWPLRASDGHAKCSCVHTCTLSPCTRRRRQSTACLHSNVLKCYVLCRDWRSGRQRGMMLLPARGS